MWEFYLAASEVAFRCKSLVVWQIQLAKNQGTVPLTRDYITDSDRGFGARQLV
jgi:cyclopropane-fatty-acyl-phospholipid synthase